MDDSIFAESMGFWNVSAPPGTWRLVACLRNGGSPGPKGEIATVLSWDNAQAQRHAAAMLGIDPATPLPDILSGALCSRALALCAMKACSEAFGAAWAEAPHGSPARMADNSTARFILFEEHDLVAVAAGFEALAASTGGSVRHSDPGLALAARDLAASGPPVEFAPAIFCAPRVEIDAKADLLWANDSAGHPHRMDARALARSFGLPWNASLAAPDGDFWLTKNFLDLPEITRRVEALGDAAFALGCSMRFDPKTDGPMEGFAIAGLQALQEAGALSNSLGAASPLGAKPLARKAL